MRRRAQSVMLAGALVLLGFGVGWEARGVGSEQGSRAGIGEATAGLSAPAPSASLDRILLDRSQGETAPAPVMAGKLDGAVGPAGRSSDYPRSRLYQQSVGPLTEAEIRALMADWPLAWIAEGLSVACGIGNARHPTGESGCDPNANGAADERGLFQISPDWADDCGITPAALYDPQVNMDCALWILEYSESIGLWRWEYWSVSP